MYIGSQLLDNIQQVSNRLIRVNLPIKYSISFNWIFTDFIPIRSRPGSLFLWNKKWRKVKWRGLQNILISGTRRISMGRWILGIYLLIIFIQEGYRNILPQTTAMWTSSILLQTFTKDHPTKYQNNNNPNHSNFHPSTVLLLFIIFPHWFHRIYLIIFDDYCGVCKIIIIIDDRTTTG